MTVSLFDYAEAVLASAVNVWATAMVDLPAMRYVAEGPFETVAAELCEQVVVSVDGITVGAPGEPQSTYAKLPREWSAAVSLSVWRECMATSDGPTPPPAGDHLAAASVTLGDLDLMWRNTAAIFNVGGCKHHSVVNAVLLNVEGAAGGSRITVNVDLLTL